MALAPEDRRRYLRHLLLAEVGDAGQERLLAAVVCGDAAEDPRVARTRVDYLRRAGVSCDPSSVVPATVANPTRTTAPDVARVASRTSLEEAAAALLGALAAVETVKQIVGAGRPLAPLTGFSLTKAEERALP